jgi:hypothetical protein
VKTEWIVGGLVASGVALFILCRPKGGALPEDVQIDPSMGKHRGLAPMYAGMDQLATRQPSKQDPRGGPADYLGYNYGATTPSVYAKGEPAQKAGAWWDLVEDNAAHIEVSPIDYGRAPLRIPKLWKDATRYWDGLTSYGGTEVVGQRVHLFHLRPSYPTRGVRSISGSLAPIGGGMSTASRVRIPAVFVPSAVA